MRVTPDTGVLLGVSDVIPLLSYLFFLLGFTPRNGS